MLCYQFNGMYFENEVMYSNRAVSWWYILTALLEYINHVGRMPNAFMHINYAWNYASIIRRPYLFVYCVYKGSSGCSCYMFDVARSIFLPYKLTPNLVEFSSFEQDRDKIKLIFYPLTGKNNSRRFSKCRIWKILDSLRGVQVQCTIRFSSAWYMPYQQLSIVDINIDKVGDTFNKE